jgi:hypothetical protein
MKKIATIILLVLSFVAFAQKVKIKKDAVLIDEVQVYKVEEAGSVQIFSSLTGKEFLVITVNTYEPDEENPAIRINSPYKVTTLRFNESGKMMYTDLRPKDGEGIVGRVVNTWVFQSTVKAQSMVICSICLWSVKHQV